MKNCYGRQKDILVLAVFVWIAFIGRTLSAPIQKVEVFQYEFRPGDSLVARLDYGRVRVTPWSQAQVEVRIRKIAPEPAQIDNVEVTCQKVGNNIFLNGYFYDYQAQSVYIDIKSAPQLNVVVWGANTAVEVAGLTGSVRAHSLTGFIKAENLSQSSSLITEHGNISYRSDIQPKGDIRLESDKGTINCLLRKDLNLRGWFRAGGKILWNDELELTQGLLEKQVGLGGPLFLASSTRGNVIFRLTDASGPLQSPTPAASEALDQRSLTDQTRPDDSRPYLRNVPVTSTSSSPADAARANRSTTSEPAVSPLADSTGGYALKVNVDWVYVNASVRDRRTNRAVPNLTKSDFEIFENGVQQTIEKFDPTEAPFSLLLLLDVSGSTKSYMSMIKRASIEFTRQIKVSDSLAVATFNSRTRLRQDFTNDRGLIASAIDRVQSGGGTAFYDALDRSVNRYMGNIEGRKAIVVFSDGVDNQLTGDFSNGSVTTFRDLYREIQEKDILIYTIFLDTENEHGRRGRSRSGSIGGVLGDIILGRGGTPPIGSGPGDPAYAEARRELDMIAEQTGGRMYSPRSINDLSYVYREIANDLRIQYTLGYHSLDPGQAKHWRELEVRVKNRGDLSVRARKGYYAGGN